MESDSFVGRAVTPEYRWSNITISYFGNDDFMNHEQFVVFIVELVSQILN